MNSLVRHCPYGFLGRMIVAWAAPFSKFANALASIVTNAMRGLIDDATS